MTIDTNLYVFVEKKPNVNQYLIDDILSNLFRTQKYYFSRLLEKTSGLAQVKWNDVDRILFALVDPWNAEISKNIPATYNELKSYTQLYFSLGCFGDSVEIMEAIACSIMKGVSARCFLRANDCMDQNYKEVFYEEGEGLFYQLSENKE